MARGHIGNPTSNPTRSMKCDQSMQPRVIENVKASSTATGVSGMSASKAFPTKLEQGTYKDLVVIRIHRD